MIKHLRVLILLFLFVCPQVYGQRATVDSLLQKLNGTTSDTSKFYIFIELAESYKNIDLDSGLYYARQLVLIAKKINDRYTDAAALDIYGYALFNAGNYPEAIETSFKALEQFKQIKDTAGQASCYIHLGFVYRNMDEYRKAIDYFSKIKPIAEYYHDSAMMCTFYIESGKAYEQLEALDTALVYTQKGLELGKYFRSPFGFGGVYTNFGTIYSKKGDADSAMWYFQYAREHTLKMQDFKTQARCYNELALHFYRNHLPDSALIYAKKALTINEDHAFTVQTLAASTLLTDIYKSQKRLDSAFAYQQVMLAAKDSLMGKEKLRRVQAVAFEEEMKTLEIASERQKMQSQIKIYALLGASILLLSIAFLLFRNNRQKQKDKTRIEKAYADLKSTQAQLIQSEKLASLGALTAGIAHEIQNPLNFVNNFSEINKELIGEWNEEMKSGNIGNANNLANDIEQNCEKIIQHGKRADSIVKSMLLHSRSSAGQKEPTDLNALCDEYLRLSYHGMRAKDKSFNCDFKTDFDPGVGKINIFPQDIGRVLLNLYNNAFYSVLQKRKTDSSYQAEVVVGTRRRHDKVEITVRDNGNGVPEGIREKIFQPFFTTKPTGQGTGLGLSLSYDIIKSHGGKISFTDNNKEGAAFVIELPAI